MRRYQLSQRAGVKFMGGKASSPINPEKCRADKRKTNDVDRPSEVSTGDLKKKVHGPR